MTVTDALKRVIDALDVETFLVCESEEEGKKLALAMMKNLGFKDVDLVFIEFIGSGARIRARAYMHRPGDQYGWLFAEEVKGND
ncbi:MAG: hypothetical protein VR72_06525 [Clostridiaceae bacterium BRH_c20a]|nr:MAG: hypothetical protein VR72_06525 [Clostridiaceae bacterium BRH_c20a]